MVVIPAKTGIQAGTGCRIKSGMTALVTLIAGLIKMSFNKAESEFEKGYKKGMQDRPEVKKET
jgi:hypothetical protein